MPCIKLHRFVGAACVALILRLPAGSEAALAEPIDLAAAHVAKHFQFLGGEWSVKDGQLLQSSTTRGAQAFFRNVDRGDVALSFRFLVHPKGNGVRAAGAIVRSSDSETFYGVHFDTRSDSVVLYVSPWHNLPDWIVLARKQVVLDEDHWYAAQVEAHGRKLCVKLDGAVVLEAEDDRYAGGLVGLYTSEGSASFKDVAVEGTPSTLARQWRDVTPPQRHQIVCGGEAAGGYAAFPDVCRTKAGDLLCVFYSGYGHVSTPNDRWPNGGRVMAVRSTDHGKNWSEPFVIADTVHDDRDPHIATLSDGTLICNWFVAPNPAKPLSENRPIAILLSRSTDNGKTWSEPTELKMDSPDWFACSAPVRELPGGSLILGLYTENAAANRVFGATVKSYDGGKSWTDLAHIGEKSGFYLDAETDVVRLRDGTLVAALRSSKTDLYFATSTDAGKTWSDVRSAGFKGHCPHFLRHSTGAILLTHRIPATALHWSLDEGKTWQGPLQIDGVDGAYPSCVELPGGVVYCVYYEEGEGSSIRGIRLRVTPAGVQLDEPK